MTNPKPLPSQERLQELFDYSVVTGTLYRRQGRYKGRPAGLKRSGKSHRVLVDRQWFSVHRLVWVWVTGTDPGFLEVDHQDVNHTNNAWHNLRLATASQNRANRRIARNNTSGLKGASWDKDNNKWQAVICHHRKQMHLGRFDTPEEAHAAYCAAAERLHGEFARAS